MPSDAIGSAPQAPARRTCCVGGLALLLIAAGPTLAAAPAAAPAATASSQRVVLVQPPKSIEDIELTDQDSRPFKLSQLRGRPALLFFGFTHCPDVCPSTLAKLGLLIDSADEKLRDTALIMISIDGDRDSPETMKAYLAQVLPHGIGLTGDPRVVRRIDAQFSGVFFKGLPDQPGGNYLVQHTSQVYLIDPQGRWCATFFNASIDEMRKATAAIADETGPTGARSP
jgi:protein SCO1